jgi:hypothetical protein
MGTKKCPRCGVTKPREGFARNRARHDGLQSNCRECYRVHARVGYERHKDRVLERSRVFYERNKEKRNAQSRQWAADNPQRSLELSRRWKNKNKALVRERRLRAYEANPGRGPAYVAAYRASKLRATPPWANLAAIEQIYVTARLLGLEVDHIVPLRGKGVCGLHVEANLRMIPLPVNRTKSNKRWPDMWDQALQTGVSLSATEPEMPLAAS